MTSSVEEFDFMRVISLFDSSLVSSQRIVWISYGKFDKPFFFPLETVPTVKELCDNLKKVMFDVLKITFTQPVLLLGDIVLAEELVLVDDILKTITPANPLVLSDIIPVNTTRQCVSCNIEFETEKEHVEHMKKHRRFKCDKCEAAFLRKEHLQRHYLKHLEVEFVCEVCGAKFARKDALTRHKARQNKCTPNVMNVPNVPNATTPTGLNFTSGIDGTTIPSGWNALRPKIEKQFKCEICNREFMTVEKYEQHKVSHVGPPQHQCTICQATFKTSQRLFKHITTHGVKVVKPFVCACGKSYMKKEALRKHKENCSTQ
jgi:KRAB domain-containing zinc finger protein